MRKNARLACATFLLIVSYAFTCHKVTAAPLPAEHRVSVYFENLPSACALPKAALVGQIVDYLMTLDAQTLTQVADELLRRLQEKEADA